MQAINLLPAANAKPPPGEQKPQGSERSAEFASVMEQAAADNNLVTVGQGDAELEIEQYPSEPDAQQTTEDEPEQPGPVGPTTLVQAAGVIAPFVIPGRSLAITANPLPGTPDQTLASAAHMAVPGGQPPAWEQTPSVTWPAFELPPPDLENGSAVPQPWTPTPSGETERRQAASAPDQPSPVTQSDRLPNVASVERVQPGVQQGPSEEPGTNDLEAAAQEPVPAVPDTVTEATPRARPQVREDVAASTAQVTVEPAATIETLKTGQRPAAESLRPPADISTRFERGAPLDPTSRPQAPLEQPATGGERPFGEIAVSQKSESSESSGRELADSSFSGAPGAEPRHVELCGDAPPPAFSMGPPPSAEPVEFVRAELSSRSIDIAPNERIALAEQITRHIAHAYAGTQDQTITIQLDPPHLGKVELTVTSRGPLVDATIIAERGPVRAGLEQSLDHLRDALAARGLDLGSVQVGAHGQRSDHPMENRAPSRAPTAHRNRHHWPSRIAGAVSVESIHDGWIDTRV